MKYFNLYEKTKIPFKYGKLDAEGVPLTNLKILKLSKSDEYLYHPTPIIQYGLALHNIISENKNTDTIEELKKIIKWLKEQIEINNGFLLIPFDHKELELENPWVSGMTQGQALSLLILSKIHFDIDLNLAINKLFNSFLVNQINGGFSKEEENEYFIEEAGDYKILNGFIYGLIGLIHYFEDSKNEKAKELICKAQNYLHKHLYKYDLGWWSLYSLKIPYHVSDKYYHQIHIKQLNYLGGYFKDEYLLNTAKRWQSYIDVKPFIRYKLARTLYLVRYKMYSLNR